MPTDENLMPSEQSGVLCTLGAATHPVVGVLAGDRFDTSWPVWLRAVDGQRLFVVWPRGFSATFDPGPTLLDEAGAVFIDGESPVTLVQLSLDPTKGTRDRPFVAQGIVETGLGQAEHCYTHRP